MKTEPESKFRADVDGLRAVAIVAVVLFHADPAWLSGGFLGVDVFFVISGYLITRQLHEDHIAGRFSLVDFYRKRVRRLFPALLFTEVLVGLLGVLALYPHEFRDLGQQIAAGTLFLSNVLLWRQTGYFDTAGQLKPLLHLWSLAIEEQFYLLWPLLLLACRHLKLSILTTAAGLLCLSLTTAMLSGPSKAAWVFFSPMTRAWELMAGACLALAAERMEHMLAALRAKVPGRWLDALPAGALLLLSWAFIAASKEDAVTSVWSLGVVLSTVILLWTVRRRSWVAYLLDNRVMVGIGRISYPLYLLHWPLLSFGIIVYGPRFTGALIAAVLCLAVAMAVFVNRVIEAPIRRLSVNRVPVALLSAGLLLLGALGTIGAMHPTWVPMARHHDAAQAAQARWPALQPERAACRAAFPEWTKDNCLLRLAGSGVVQDGILILGDSHAYALSMGVASLQGSPPFMHVGKNGCLPFVGVERFDQNGPLGCALLTQRSLQWIKDRSMHTVVLAARYSYYVHGLGYGELDAMDRPLDNLHIQPPGPRLPRDAALYAAVFEQGLAKTMEALHALDVRVIIVHQVPELGFDPSQCLARVAGGGGRPCEVLRGDVQARQALYRAIFTRVLRHYPEVVLVDPMDDLCDSVQCYAVKNSKRLYRDDDHLSLDGATALALRATALIHGSAVARTVD